jgi:hypothetical protein
VYTKHRLGTSKRQSQPLFCTYWWRYTRYTKHMLGTSKQRWVPRKGSPNLCFVHTGGGTHDTQNTCWAPRNSRANLCFVPTCGGTHDTQNTCWACRMGGHNLWFVTPSMRRRCAVHQRQPPHRLCVCPKYTVTTCGLVGCAGAHGVYPATLLRRTTVPLYTIRPHRRLHPYGGRQCRGVA